ncbi:AGAP007174-PA [Anopheles gambiae str. PEST]|uniref:AGAP007174-PA n=1 Tax=Anopheles gambiae TaxID=7165 RepID=Q7PT51_ANOGA|nr:AGAP007174-PA [Anopheles gambiae str. PEST]
MSISNGKTSSDIENVDWNSSGMLTHTRYGSTSSQVSQSSGDICRICHCESDTHNPLLTPCYCSGSLKFVHQTCLQQWLTASETNSCELCKFPFIMHTKIKPFNEWRSLDMSGVERRRLCCAVLFHCAAGLCVIWSLCVLIERAAEEVRRGQIGWPFWTKLIVVTVGLTGGVVFMYIQCKQYLNLCNRWRARNRILLIQNVPEKVHPPQSPQMPQFRRVQTAATSGQPLGGGGTMGINAVNNAVTASVAAAAAAAAAARQSSYDHPLGAATVNVSLGGGGPSTVGGGNHCELQLNQQGQIIAANIESNSIGGYDRDWTLDDISQVSFKPCLQGSGSLTPMPFHDSVHNICETTTGSGSGIMVMSATSTMAGGGGGGGGNATSSSPITTNGNGSTHRYSTVSSSSNPGGAEQNTNSVGKSIAGGGGPELSLLTKLNNGAAERSRSNSPNVVPRPEAGPTPGAMGRYVNSAIFLENRDILNDPALGPTGHDEPPASKLYHRHSTVLSGGGAAAAAPPPVGLAAGFGREEALATQSVATEPSKSYRRYSDTKLLQKQSLSFPQEPLALCEIGTHTKDQLLLNPKSIIYDMTSLLGPANALQTTDIQFESGAPLDDDALEMNIQEILEYDQLQQQQQQQLHYYAPDKHSPRALVEQRLSLENILQSSYHDDPGAVPVRPYYDHHGHSMLSLSLASKTPPPHPPSTLLSGAAGVGGSHVVAPPQIVPATLSTDYPYPRSTMAGTVVVAESPYQQQQQQQMHPQLQQQRSHCCGETVDASRFASDSNKLKLFKSLPNLSASSENLLP